MQSLILEYVGFQLPKNDNIKKHISLNKTLDSIIQIK